MSIIQDALKKIEDYRNDGLKPKIDEKNRPKFKVYLVYALFVFLGFFITNIAFRIILKSLLNNNVTVKSQPVPGRNNNASMATRGLPEEAPALKPAAPSFVKDKKEQAGSFILNGVFFSENESYALINNRVVKEGDSIDGAKVIKISLDEVKLESQGSIIRLSK